MIRVGSSLAAVALFVSTALAETKDDQTFQPPTPLPYPTKVSVKDFLFEIAMLCFFAAYIAIWYVGGNKNLAIAKKWTGAQLEYLRTQFAHVGDNAGNTLVKDSPNEYVLYTTGRRNMKFAHWFVTLYPRNDITTAIANQVLALAGWEKPAKDHVTATVTLDDSSSEGFVFAVLPEATSKELRADRFDLKKFTKTSQHSKLPKNLVVSCESSDLADLLLEGKVADVIREAGDAFNSLIITCYPTVAPESLKESYPQTVTVDFDINSSDAKASSGLVQLVCELPDILSARCRNFKPEIKNKLRKNREEVLKEYAKIHAEERAEELAKKKADAKKAEEERVRKLSPAEQRKWEEKERAKELKKSQKKRVKKA
ncbi:hypothetical protein K450DRAFT_199440 [Umbelopsis ramanniana AG]|uniref:Coiled-coil domain-containing protein 47 n=1 Tax=Umbelopsis ramanniana AG TaxID=1314678 RepID=A0AAD5E958_UMBRA|nr:uncharacterized protein K450DRAFT_199440 [Umbelopsis ramanniana AG]KAI8579428.1 hypothetical protein K450DRAFT_199440 [Umbelopsis ramanniana AG]